MGIFDRFPYSSTHEMNLDFMLGKATEIAEDMQQVTAGMEQVQAGLTAISEKTEQATQAAAAAAQSASSIEGSVAAAEEAAEEAQMHNESAQTWANNAMTYKADCQRAATEAAASSSSAAQAATAAAASEDTVATYAQAANASAQSAANNNDSAHQYANQASASASNATFHSSNAQTAATNANTSATNAETAATNAQTAATRASALKDDCQTLHSMCTTAVDLAAEQAVAAANSAAQAAASKTDVENLVESLPEDFTDLNNTVNQLSDEIDAMNRNMVALHTDTGFVLPFEPVTPSTLFPVSIINSPVSSLALTVCKKNLFNDAYMSQYATNTPHEFYGTCENFQNLPNYVFNFPAQKHFVLSFSAKGTSATTTATIRMVIYYTDGTNRTEIVSNAAMQTQEYVRKNIDIGAGTYQNKTIEYIKFAYGTGANEYIYIKDVQIEMGSTLTDFEPFVGTTYTQELPNTIGSGEYNWASGILTNTTTEPAVYTQLDTHIIPALDGKLFAMSAHGKVQMQYALSFNGLAKLAGKKCVCFGDSITANYEFPIDYPAIIMKNTGMDVYNVGFGGCKMSYHSGVNSNYAQFSMYSLADSIVSGDYSAKRTAAAAIYANNRANLAYIDSYSGDYYQYAYERIDILESMDWENVDFITISYGTNDWNSDIPLDNANNKLDTTTFCGAARYAIEKILTAYPNIKILLIAPIWRWFAGEPYTDSDTRPNGSNVYLYQFGEALADVAKEYHLPILDMYWNLGIGKLNRLEYFKSTDGTHPLATGLKLIGDRISEKMNQW